MALALNKETKPVYSCICALELRWELYTNITKIFLKEHKISFFTHGFKYSYILLILALDCCSIKLCQFYVIDFI